MREVFVLGAGLHPFGRFPEKSYVELGCTATERALADAGMGWQDIQAAFYSHANFQTIAPGETVLGEMGLNGIPIMSVENACSAGTSAVWLGYHMVSNGLYDIVLCVGAEKMGRGGVAITDEANPTRLLGTDFMMASYALEARRYMATYHAPAEAIAMVSVINHKNGCLNPYSQYQKAYTLDEVMNSRMIADPLTLYQCCPTTDGGAAVVLCSKEIAQSHSRKPLVKVASAALLTQKYSRDMDERQLHVLRAGQEAYEKAGIKPKDVDIAEVHDAATIGEILRIEALGLFPEGEGWRAVQEGRVGIKGDVAVNPSGGLQAQGHPMGATGIRQVAELTWHLRGEAGERQVPNARVGLAQTSGAGVISGVCILEAV